MKQNIIFCNTKQFVSTFSVLDEVLKRGSHTRLKKHLLKLRSSSDRVNSKVASGITR